jgi:Methyltransferase domain
MVSLAPTHLIPAPIPDSCRLCGGPTEVAFRTKVLGRHQVSYFVCATCGCLQSETPYWLDEAYQQAIVATDTGAVRRSVISHVAIACIAKVLRVKGRFLDFGGGTGMLCRLLRDRGFDAYIHDKYAEPVYASGFVLDLEHVEPGSIGLLSAIEVLEHCAHPATDVGRLFAARPQVLVATTVPYHGEKEDWWYLGPSTGQHVFFFSPKGLRFLAQKHGYHYLGVGAFHIFSVRPIGRGDKLILELLLSRVGLRAASVWMTATQRTRHSEADFNALLDKLPRDRKP